MGPDDWDQEQDVSDDDWAERNSLVGRFDQAMYGDLLSDFGSNAKPDDDYFRSLTDASEEEYGAAGHDFRNDSEVRDPKPYSDDY